MQWTLASGDPEVYLICILGWICLLGTIMQQREQQETVNVCLLPTNM